jgi:hypothetical protein
VFILSLGFYEIEKNTARIAGQVICWDRVSPAMSAKREN